MIKAKSFRSQLVMNYSNYNNLAICFFKINDYNINVKRILVLQLIIINKET